MVSTINRTAEPAQPPPRERILAAARELFYRHGIRAVGVEAIAEAAATNKMTLYRHFGSKDELIAAYLNQLAKEGDDVWEALAREHPGDANAQLEGWVRYVEKVLTDGGERGCAIANAAVEMRELDHPARKIIDDYKTRKRNRLVALFREAGYEDPDQLADEVFLLFEGARISLQCCSSGPASRVVRMLRSLLAEHAPKPRE
ncbi:MAG: TetR/AcrR family transcriptional regulator [Hyphomicrobium sp.]|uniref:TetR/AcrR family transcriptional regulator n=1 Tax=Hyphomicrobium sp. TaxID=82 RepID=UPI0013263505|nr:TetR/AcrR family transcriptional regulator [Hyphomicrobium sp.]KAB2940534.1 MAG: TetR/AcrR family transcriptional regulator [Hyphomicrobium sp.]MBZ0210317.1 TetR/AcrR family transcriptional regulator [Hyphomicrobium sp.]